MKHKKIIGFAIGLILPNIYFAVEDNKKLNKLREEIKKIEDRKLRTEIKSLNGQIIN
jgi:hypothetical protein